MSKELISKILQNQPSSVRNNVKILDKKETGVDYLIRLDSDFNERKLFIPYISPSQAPSENRTLPRVVTSTNIIGCIKAIFHLILPDMISKSLDKLTLSYHILAIDFDYCLKPNEKMVYDANISDEHWLITYNKETIKYRPFKIGELFVTKYIAKMSEKSKNNKTINVIDLDVELAIKINKDYECFLTKKEKLKDGCYIVLINSKRVSINSSEEKEVLEIKKIEDKEYQKLRSKTALESLFDYIINECKLSKW